MSMVFAGDLRTFEDEDDGEAVFKPGSYMNLTNASGPSSSPTESGSRHSHSANTGKPHSDYG